MRKALKFPVALFTLFLVGTSCEDNSNINPAKDRQVPNASVSAAAADDGWGQTRNMSAQLFIGDFNDLDVYMGRVEEYVYINYERMSRDNMIQLINGFQATSVDAASFSRVIHDNVRVLKNQTSSYNVAADVPNLANHLSSSQIQFLNWHFSNLSNATSETSATFHYGKALNKINTIFLSDTEKATLMFTVEHTNQFAVSFFRNQWHATRMDILTEFGRQGDGGSGCSVSFRDALRSGVVSGLRGLVAGAVVGAAGGTVVVPGVGTVAGGVGVGIIGLATGFGAGVVSSVGEQLLWNCLFKSPKKMLDPRCNDANFAVKNAKYCLEPQADRRLYVAYND